MISTSEGPLSCVARCRTSSRMSRQLGRQGKENRWDKVADLTTLIAGLNDNTQRRSVCPLRTGAKTNRTIKIMRKLMENIYTTLTVTVHTQGATFYFMLRHLKCALVGVSVCVRMPDGKRIVPPLLNISLQYNFTPGHTIDMKSDCIRGAHCKKER